jgi:hypothetical protein
MDKPYESIFLARKAIDGLREATRYTYLLADKIRLNPISLNQNELIRYETWTYIQAFMTKKMSAIFLGETDYEPAIQDLNFSFRYIKGYKNE